MHSLPHYYQLKSPPRPPSTVSVTSSSTESLPNAGHWPTDFIYTHPTNLVEMLSGRGSYGTIGQVGKLRSGGENHLSVVTQRRSCRSVIVGS